VNRLAGRVAFITGAARGQGRSHAVRLAEEGADIIALDICRQLPSVFDDMSTKDDLAETKDLVRATGRRIVTGVADVREFDEMEAVYDAGVEALGVPDIILRNAGIMPVLDNGDSRAPWYAIDVMLTGVCNTLELTVPGLIERGTGGSITITSSTAGLKGLPLNRSPGQAAYVASKHGVVGLMRLYAALLGEHSIRVNSLHPTGVNTPMVVNPGFAEFGAQHPEAFSSVHNALPIRRIEPIDISNAIVFLASEEGRYITGVALPVDAGLLVL